jgi:hypothetical protein
MAEIETNVAKAEAEAAEGDKRIKGTIWERMTKDKDRFIEAAQFYTRSGNYYRLAKKCSSSFPSLEPQCIYFRIKLQNVITASIFLI